LKTFVVKSGFNSIVFAEIRKGRPDESEQPLF